MKQSVPEDHTGMGVLPLETCLEHLSSARIGRVAFLADGYPIILPVNHGVDHGTVVFRTTEGSKLDAAELQLPVAFEVDGFDAERRTGWSVLVRGIAAPVASPAEIARLSELRVWPWADSVSRTSWVRITAHEITGRQIVHHYNY
ncbi:Nitroimidazol reductase NimA, pyridoxamine 5'-phosphate oxidase superfamily [Nakamurella panacisegetis]|uniref:Nitroimidazol reductase NimA, pyridoxamine 5'-phosphate oxidase superfamily n=1 Tax=Nakamurella panacisegetis TaxID=1090615 RepID=A0A1H0SBC1_9ACTN|nr:pyridoxamine 5'-phosphate oxidase family protein [Nakamurella panacisegetis]SDP39030.1 Nitroimidazol reductase NimA, pyridoxamine 5'-phosphate oxidase superfamily [Nakamurella panacisegetis]